MLSVDLIMCTPKTYLVMCMNSSRLMLSCVEILTRAAVLVLIAIGLFAPAPVPWILPDNYNFHSNGSRRFLGTRQGKRCQTRLVVYMFAGSFIPSF